MKKTLLSLSICACIISICVVVSAQKTYAATLNSVSDTISTSRPSASEPLNSNVTAGTTPVTVYDNYNATSVWLASDSAIFRPDTGETSSLVTVASASASSGGIRTIYFVSGPSNNFHSGVALTVPITAVHTVTFKTINAIPGSGQIVITFPNQSGTDGVSSASPSASTFQFNNLSSSNIVTNNVTCSSFTISAPSITCNVNGSGVAAGTVVTMIIGCSAQSSGACTTAVPTLINPTKSNTTAGAADTWSVNISTNNGSGTLIDSSNIKIATVESIQVQATIDPTLTVTIAGLNSGSNYNSSSSSCPSEVSNSGINSTATLVNLGILSNGTINEAGQTITITTNAANGYTITASSSGRFINPATGQWIFGANSDGPLTANDTPAPASFLATGNADFGVSPCGARVNNTLWNGNQAFAFGSGAKASNPFNTGSNTFFSTIANYSGGPISGDVTVLRYAGTISGISPAGVYGNAFTYVVTPSF